MFCERQLTDKSDLPSSLQIAMENLPKLALTMSKIWETAKPSLAGHSMFRCSPSQAYDVWYGDTSRFRGVTEKKNKHRFIMWDFFKGCIVYSILSKQNSYLRQFSWYWVEAQITRRPELSSDVQ